MDSSDPDEHKTDCDEDYKDKGERIYDKVEDSEPQQTTEDWQMQQCVINDPIRQNVDWGENNEDKLEDGELQQAIQEYQKKQSGINDSNECLTAVQAESSEEMIDAAANVNLEDKSGKITCEVSLRDNTVIHPDVNLSLQSDDQPVLSMQSHIGGNQCSSTDCNIALCAIHQCQMHQRRSLQGKECGDMVGWCEDYRDKFELIYVKLEEPQHSAQEFQKLQCGMNESNEYLMKLKAESSEDVIDTATSVKLEDESEQITCEASCRDEGIIHADINLTPTSGDERVIEMQSYKGRVLHSFGDRDIASGETDQLQMQQESLMQGKEPECRKCGREKCQKCNCIKNRRTLKKPFKCQECGKTFGRRYILTEHYKIHTGEQPFQCKECGKKFSRKYNFTEHSRIHTGENPLKCEECGKVLAHKKNLTRHMKTHTGEKPFVCKECNKAFSEKGILTEHMKIHTGEKPYICKECDQAFRHRSGLIRHIRKHTGKNLCLCNECGKLFGELSYLTQHIKTHREERPFECLECGKAFKQKYELTKHIKTHTGQKPFK